MRKIIIKIKQKVTDLINAYRVKVTVYDELEKAVVAGCIAALALMAFGAVLGSVVTLALRYNI